MGFCIKKHLYPLHDCWFRSVLNLFKRWRDLENSSMEKTFLYFSYFPKKFSAYRYHIMILLNFIRYYASFDPRWRFFCSSVHLAQLFCNCSTAASELADIEWDNLGFGFLPTDFMYMMKCTQDGNFSEGELQRFGNIELNPSAGVLNYGQVRFLNFHA